MIIEPRRGDGWAYRTGFAAAQGEILATLDGDGTYPGPNGSPSTSTTSSPSPPRHALGGPARLHRPQRDDHRAPDRQLGAQPVRPYRLPPLPAGPSERGAPRQPERDVGAAPLPPPGNWRTPGRDGAERGAEDRGDRPRVPFEEVPIRYAKRWGAPKLSSWRDGQRNLAYLFTKRLQLQRERSLGPRGPSPRGKFRPGAGSPGRESPPPPTGCRSRGSATRPPANAGWPRGPPGGPWGRGGAPGPIARVRPRSGRRPPPCGPENSWAEGESIP